MKKIAMKKITPCPKKPGPFDVDDHGEYCPKRKDGTHCRCWWEGEVCCGCKAPAMADEQKRAQGMEI